MPRILLVEDNPGDARLVQEILREVPNQPFEVHVVDSLGLALDVLAKQAPDVILLDLHLRDSAGLPTLLRCRAGAPQTPIVILSGLEDEALCLSAMRQGAQDYLVKGSITGPSLARALRYAIERSQTMQATVAAPINGEIRRHLDIIQAEQAILLRLLGAAAASPERAAAIEPGAVAADRYLILDQLAEGASGVAFLAQDQLLERRVVLKRLRTSGKDPAAVRAFMKEARLAASIEHPHVVRIYDFGYVGEEPFLVMEWAEGGSLRDRLSRGTLAPLESARVTIALLDGLAHLHSRGILHRDVKAANLLFARDLTPKLADFGLALVPSAEETRDALSAPHASAGSPATMSPEAADGKRLTPQSDLYSVGALMYEMVAGAPYLDLEGLTWPQMRRAIINDTPRALPADVPTALSRVIRKALAKDPAERFASSEIMCRELTRVAVKLEGGS